MDLEHQNFIESLTSPPRIQAKYRSVIWEPIQNTGERLAALVCVEPAGDSAGEFAAGTYVVLKQETLRAVFGRARGDSAHRTLTECANFMTSRLQRGEPLEYVKPLFQGFSTGPVLQARAYSVAQLLDAIVRTVSSLGSTAEVFPESLTVPVAVTQGTASFIRQVRRTFAADDESLQRRFNVCLQRNQNEPPVWVDYASKHIILQLATVPSSINQAPPAEAELKAKILDLEVVRQEFGDNKIQPALMLNTFALKQPKTTESLQISQRAHSTIQSYARWAKLRIIEVADPVEAARALDMIS